MEKTRLQMAPRSDSSAANAAPIAPLHPAVSHVSSPPRAVMIE
jgi:hypothetical protein